MVELFFKWIKQHLKVKRFWGDSETAVRIQINVAIATYCLMAIVEKELGLNRNTCDENSWKLASDKRQQKGTLDPARRAGSRAKCAARILFQNVITYFNRH